MLGMSSIHDLKDRRMTISHHLCRTYPPTSDTTTAKKNKRVRHQANMPSFTRIGTITLKSGALDTMIPARVGKYDRRGPPTRSKRHREAFATQNTYTLRLVGLQTVGYNYWTSTTVPGTVHRAQSTSSTYWIEFYSTQQLHTYNNYMQIIIQIWLHTNMILSTIKVYIPVIKLLKWYRCTKQALKGNARSSGTYIAVFPNTYRIIK